MGGKIQSIPFFAEVAKAVKVLPDFLPPILNLEGAWDEILEMLYSVFSTDFKQNAAKHCGLNVRYDIRILPDGLGKEEGFWHVISKGPTTQRLIDFRRGERLPWARPMMESGQRSELRVFDYDHGPRDKGIRRYIWLKDFDYALVLQQKKNTFFWITAFYTSSNGRKDLKRRYEGRLKRQRPPF